MEKLACGPAKIAILEQKLTQFVQQRVDPDTLQLRELEDGARKEREKRFTQVAGMFTSPPGTSWEKGQQECRLPDSGLIM